MKQVRMRWRALFTSLALFLCFQQGQTEGASAQGDCIATRIDELFTSHADQNLQQSDRWQAQEDKNRELQGTVDDQEIRIAKLELLVTTLAERLCLSAYSAVLGLGDVCDDAPDEIVPAPASDPEPETAEPTLKPTLESCDGPLAVGARVELINSGGHTGKTGTVRTARIGQLWGIQLDGQTSTGNWSEDRLQVICDEEPTEPLTKEPTRPPTEEPTMAVVEGRNTAWMADESIDTCGGFRNIPGTNIHLAVVSTDYKQKYDELDTDLMYPDAKALEQITAQWTCPSGYHWGHSSEWQSCTSKGYNYYDQCGWSDWGPRTDGLKRTSFYFKDAIFESTGIVIETGGWCTSKPRNYPRTFGGLVCIEGGDAVPDAPLPTLEPTEGSKSPIQEPTNPPRPTWMAEKSVDTCGGFRNLPGTDIYLAVVSRDLKTRLSGNYAELDERTYPNVNILKTITADWACPSGYHWAHSSEFQSCTNREYNYWDKCGWSSSAPRTDGLKRSSFYFKDASMRMVLGSGDWCDSAPRDYPRTFAGLVCITDKGAAPAGSEMPTVVTARPTLEPADPPGFTGWMAGEDIDTCGGFKNIEGTDLYFAVLSGSYKNSYDVLNSNYPDIETLRTLTENWGCPKGYHWADSSEWLECSYKRYNYHSDCGWSSAGSNPPWAAKDGISRTAFYTKDLLATGGADWCTSPPRDWNRSVAGLICKAN